MCEPALVDQIARLQSLVMLLLEKTEYLRQRDATHGEEEQVAESTPPVPRLRIHSTMPPALSRALRQERKS